MVGHQIELQPRIGGIFGVGIAAHQLGQGIARLAGDALVAGHVADLVIIAQRDQIIGIGRVAVAGMQLQEPLRRGNGFGILRGSIIVERAHQLRPARPWRIGMLALDLVEQGASQLILAIVHAVLGCGIKCVDVARDIAGIARAIAAPGTGGEQEGGDGGGGNRQTCAVHGASYSHGKAERQANRCASPQLCVRPWFRRSRRRGIAAVRWYGWHGIGRARCCHRQHRASPPATPDAPPPGSARRAPADRGG